MISFLVILGGLMACCSIGSWLNGFIQAQEVVRHLPVRLGSHTYGEQNDLTRTSKQLLANLGAKLSLAKVPTISQPFMYGKVEIQDSRDWYCWTASGTLVGFVLGFLMILMGLPFAIIWMIFFLVAGNRLPHIIFHLAEKQKKKKLSQEFPDFLDIISICMQSGLTFQDSIRFYVDQFSSTIADEFQYMLDQMRLGIQQEEAMRQIAERNPIKEVQVWVRTWLYAKQFGTPLATFMSKTADQIRKASLETIKEQAGKSGPKISLVTGIVLVPSIFILLVTMILLYQFSGPIGQIFL